MMRASCTWRNLIFFYLSDPALNLELCLEPQKALLVQKLLQLCQDSCVLTSDDRVFWMTH